MLKIFLLILMILGFCTNAVAKDIVNIYDIPRKVPIRTVYHESGKRYLLSDFKGEFVLVVFWSKTCAICVRELDNLNNFHNTVKGNGIKVIAVSPSSDWVDDAQAKNFLRRRGAPDLDVYIDEEGDLAADFGIYSTPHSVLINRKGEEIGRIRGGAQWDDEKIIEYFYKVKAKHG